MLKNDLKKQKNKVLSKLEEVLDPETNISIVDLGLIYNVKPKKNKVEIIMTLTSIGCPLFNVIESDIKTKLQEIGYKNVKIKLTFNPAWTMDRMSEKGKAILGI